MSESSSKPIHRHHYHSWRNRAIYCLAIAGLMLILGTLGFHAIEGFSYIDAFYFSSLIATGQGPAPEIHPSTSFGKLFTCVFAFFSVGSMVASLGFLFGPFLGQLFHIGILKLEKEFKGRDR